MITNALPTPPEAHTVSIELTDSEVAKLVELLRLVRQSQHIVMHDDHRDFAIKMHAELFRVT